MVEQRRNACRSFSSVLYHLAIFQFLVIYIFYSQWALQSHEDTFYSVEGFPKRTLTTSSNESSKEPCVEQQTKEMTEFERTLIDELRSVKEALLIRDKTSTEGAQNDIAIELKNIRDALLVREQTTTQAIQKVKTFPSKRVLFREDYSGSDNHGIPGRFFHDKLFVMGARLTTSYEEEDNSVSFDMFAHGVGDGAGFNTVEDRVNGTLLSYNNASQLRLFCQVLSNEDPSEDQSTPIPMELIPLKSLDSNVRRSTLIWRCNVSNSITKQDMIGHPNGHVHVRVNTHDGEYVMTTSVPITTSSVGYGGPQFRGGPDPSFVSQVAKKGPVGVVLCVAGVAANGFEYLPEFVQHHRNIGVGQIVIGVDITHDSREMQQVRFLLSRFIEEGTVVLSPTYVSGFKGRNMRGTRKFQFYHQCLYHAKGMSEFVAAWDNDEFWIPPVELPAPKGNVPSSTYAAVEHDELWKDSIYSRRPSLPEAARSIRGKDECDNWCFQAFPCFEVHHTNPLTETERKKRDLHEQRMYGFDKRDPEPTYARQKSIARTKNAFALSMHLAGSCPNVEKGEIVYKQQIRECPLVVKRNETHGSMHHFYAMMAPSRTRRRQWNSSFPNEEYTFEMRNTVLEQLRKST